ncbi:hypothetical protein EJ05DRAFT_131527 [Pseudovirgaria hyperparasitica]|uniref:WW-domain-binding protein n=1 Tax=Pseudovirgaria hyperparasitica TaxID=470096 RepID=A0A6A6VYI9_9PEZI|nr:uncharacterized protein EJ05DRAFT_131527 [Pseudovirgaria hyperparasitica]KAF2754730.1 hypothetical protein EJ05DRAFT_131527 [Pseudovirgaria hyperparasitica]
MSINWVMLSDAQNFTPLPNEETLYKSPPRTTLSLQTLNKYPGREPFHVTSSSGTIHLTNRRVVYLPQTPSPTLQSFAAPILNLHDTHVDSPWFGPNTWTALVQPVAGGNIPPQHAALELKITFKEGGAFDFSARFERVKERLQQAVEVARESGHAAGDGSETGRGLGGGALAGVNLDAVHLDELPAYEPGSGVPVPPEQVVEQQEAMRRDSEILSGSTGPNSPRVPAAPFTPPAEPPPGYEEAQMDSVADELERRLRRDG